MGKLFESFRDAVTAKEPQAFQRVVVIEAGDTTDYGDDVVVVCTGVPAKRPGPDKHE